LKDRLSPAAVARDPDRAVAMARSNGRAAVAAVLAALGYLLLTQLVAFVAPAGPSSASSRRLRYRVSLAATQADVDAAKKEFELKQWAASHLASQGSPQAAAAAARAQQAEAAYAALTAQLDGQAPAATPAAPTPVAAVSMPAPVAAATAPSAVSKEDLAAAKHNAQLLTWAASKLASEGAPQAASMKAKADQAVAAFEALKQAQVSGAAAPAAATPAPVAAVPAVAPAAAAPPPVTWSPSGPSDKEVAKAKTDMELHEWAASTLASKGSLTAAAMQAKAEQSRQTYEALVALQKAKQLVPR